MQSLFEISDLSSVTISKFLICIGAALVFGLFISLAYSFRSVSSKSFAMTLAILPALVTVVIVMVNGNLGAGVAVAGAFSLVRFRSAQGTAREIAAIFLAMGTGLITGMGCIGYAALFVLIMCAAFMLYTAAGLGAGLKPTERTLRITIPEDLDYVGVFDDLLEEYTTSSELLSVQTSNMGSLFKLKYDIDLKSAAKEKEFLDKLRVRNGNLEIAMSVREDDRANEL